MKMEKSVLQRKGLEEIFTGFEKRQDEKFKAIEKRVIDQFHVVSE